MKDSDKVRKLKLLDFKPYQVQCLLLQDAFSGPLQFGVNACPLQSHNMTAVIKGLIILFLSEVYYLKLQRAEPRLVYHVYPCIQKA